MDGVSPPSINLTNIVLMSTGLERNWLVISAISQRIPCISGNLKKYLTDLYYYGSLNYVETINGGEKAMKKVHINITIDEDLNDWIEKMALELRAQ